MLGDSPPSQLGLSHHGASRKPSGADCRNNRSARYRMKRLAVLSPHPYVLNLFAKIKSGFAKLIWRPHTFFLEMLSRSAGCEAGPCTRGADTEGGLQKQP